MLKPILPVSFRSPIGKRIPKRTLSRALACAALLSALPLSCGISSAQQQGAQPPFSSAPNTSPMGPRGNRADGPTTMIEEEKRLKELNILRQKEITAESARLLLLAAQVKNGVEKSGEDTTSLELIHKVEQIEKLARSVRTKMSDGIVN